MFCFEQRVYISSPWFLHVLPISQRKPGTNEDRKATKTNHSEYKGNCSRAFVVKGSTLPHLEFSRRLKSSQVIAERLSYGKIKK